MNNLDKILDLISNVIAVNFPIDILAAIAGGLAGLFLVNIWDWIIRPKIKFLGFSLSEFNCGGRLHKLKFKINGKQNPGICQLEIKWCGNTVKAKWDESPNPVENDDCNKFRPELVPATFYQSLFLKSDYEVPIIHEKDGDLSIFSGWWFGRNLGYGDYKINRNTEITLVLSGNNFQWEKTMKASDIIDNH